MPRPRIPARRDRILDVAHDLALEKGWRATTVADVAAGTGIGKGAVYLEFPDKPAILDAALSRSMRNMVADIHQQVLATDEVIDLPAIYEFAVDALLRDTLMRAFYVGDESVLGDHVRSVEDDRYGMRFQWLLDYIGSLQDAGVINAETPRATVGRVLSVFTIGLLHSPGTLGPLTDEQLRESVGLFAHLVGRGLATDLPADPRAARAAQSDLLETLDAQLVHLQTP